MSFLGTSQQSVKDHFFKFLWLSRCQLRRALLLQVLSLFSLLFLLILLAFFLLALRQDARPHIVLEMRKGVVLEGSWERLAEWTFLQLPGRPQYFFVRSQRNTFTCLKGVLCMRSGIVEEGASRRQFCSKFGVVGTEIDDGVWRWAWLHALSIVKYYMNRYKSEHVIVVIVTLILSWNVIAS